MREFFYRQPYLTLIEYNRRCLLELCEIYRDIMFMMEREFKIQKLFFLLVQ